MHKVDFDIGVVTYHPPVMTVCRQEGMVDPRAGAKVNLNNSALLLDRGQNRKLAKMGK